MQLVAEILPALMSFRMPLLTPGEATPLTITLDKQGSIDLSELVLFVTKTRKQAAKTQERWGPELSACHRYLHGAALSIGGPVELFKVIDKNKDALVQDLKEVLQCSEERFVGSLFEAGAADDDSTSSNSRNGGRGKGGGRRAVPASFNKR